MTGITMGTPFGLSNFPRMSLQNLRVYQASEQLDALVLPLVENLPNRYYKDVDNIIRAIGSLRANISEAYGSGTPGRKAYHLGLARGSSDEVRDGLRRLVARGALAQKDIWKADALASSIAKMLTAWIKKLKSE